MIARSTHLSINSVVVLYLRMSVTVLWHGSMLCTTSLNINFEYHDLGKACDEYNNVVKLTYVVGEKIDKQYFEENQNHLGGKIILNIGSLLKNTMNE